MTNYTVEELYSVGAISKRLKQVLVILGCKSFRDMQNLSEDKIMLDYIEKSHHLKSELLKAVSDIKELDQIIPELTEKVQFREKSPKNQPSSRRKKKFKVGDYTEELLKVSPHPIKQEDLLIAIKKFLPNTYIESIRANLSGDRQKRFVFFLDGYVGLKGKQYDKRYQEFSIENKKVQYAEQRIMEFMSFVAEKHRSPQPHGLEEEESLYRWYSDFTKSTSKEFADLKITFKEYLKEYDKWMFNPYEYTYKRNCDQIRWYVDNNMELPSSEDEPELSAWFNSQLENHRKHKDKRKQMFIDLMTYLEDYGMHFYDAKSERGKSALKKKRKESDRSTANETTTDKYIRLFEEMKNRSKGKEFAIQKSLLLVAIGNLIQKQKINTNEITLNDDLLTEFADVCIDMMGTASSYNIAIPYYYMAEEPFWSSVPKESVLRETHEEEEITYDYIEATIESSIIDYDLFEVLSNNSEFEQLKKSLINNVIKDKHNDEANLELESVTIQLPNKQEKDSGRGFCVIFPDGSYICDRKAIVTFIDTLRKIGLERVHKVGITHGGGYNLVSKEKRPVEPNRTWQHECDGWYIYSNISNSAKIDDLKRISDYFHLGLKIGESKYE